ncbi:MAG: RimJ/RimL family protein N-acetyltransferase [Maribacter sp.]|jgi:RimJ/RimL family protein N-acetyltransferase
MQAIITTERLVLRTWKETDFALMAEMNMDEEVMRYFPSTQGLEKTSSFCQRMNQQFKEKKYCYFATEILKTDEFIGFIGMSYHTYEAPHSPFTDIGWRLKRSAWGNGYATEGAKGCLKYAFEELKLKEIFSVAPTINAPSIHIMQKIGMKEVQTFIHPFLAEDKRLKECILYRIEK